MFLPMNIIFFRGSRLKLSDGYITHIHFATVSKYNNVQTGGMKTKDSAQL